MQHRLRHFGIGNDKAEHGGHIRVDHAGTFGNAGGAHGVVLADFSLAAGGFGHGVGGHDGAGGIAPMRGFHAGQGAGDFLRRQGLENHAGGKGQHLLDVAAHLRGHGCAHRQRIFAALCAGAGIGVARVDHQRADAVFIG